MKESIPRALILGPWLEQLLGSDSDQVHAVFPDVGLNPERQHGTKSRKIEVSCDLVQTSDLYISTQRLHLESVLPSIMFLED